VAGGPSIVVKVLGDLKGLGEAVTGIGATAESAAGRAHSAFSGVLDTLNKSGVLGPFGESLAAIDESIGKVTEHGKAIGVAMMGVGGTLVGVGAGLQALGSKDQAAHQQLQASIEATGQSYEDYAGQVEAAIGHQEKFGDTAGQTQDALRLLTQATHDPQQALDLLSTATDIAAAKHEDLSTAATQLGKVYNGNTKLLKEYGIVIDKNTGLTKDGKTAMQALADVTGGQASAAADTFTGHLNAIKAHIEDAAAAFGQKYGPAITAAGAAMTGLGAAIEVTSAVTSALKDSTLLQAAASKAAELAQWLWNAAMDANPIMLIVLAIAALVAGVILAYNNIAVFRDLVDGAGKVMVAAFTAVSDAAVAVWNWISANWPLLLAILTGPFGLMVDVIVKNWDSISNAIVGVWNWITGNWPLLLGILTGPIGAAVLLIVSHFDDVKQAATDVYDWVKGKFDAIAGAISNVVGAVAGAISSVVDAIKAPINAVIRAFNGIEFRIPSFTLPSFDVGPVHLGGETVGGVTIGFPDIPQLAQGGLITSTGLVYAHAGEVISPTPAGIGGPAVHIDNATFMDPVDIDVFMARVAWAVRSSAA
jgi:hypothetical protein